MKRSLRSWLWRVPIEEEVDEELRFHREMRMRQLIASGLAPDAARREAERQAGDRHRVRQQMLSLAGRRDRERTIMQWIQEARHDLRFALRQLAHSPGFAVVTTVTLALGIGATTAIFSVVHAVVLRPFAIPDPERVMILQETWDGNPSSVSVGNFHDWRTHAKSFAALAADSSTSFNLTDGEIPERLTGSRATYTLFDVYQLPPLLGRTFTERDDRPGAPPVVVLSHRLWARRFASDRALVGTALRLNGQSYEVIGVMPPALDAIDASAELWVPAAFTPEQIAQHDEHFLTGYARLAPGVSREAAQTELRLIFEQMKRQFPGDEQVRVADVLGFADTIVGDYKQRLLVLLGAVSLVLLIACGNVAHLLLARGSARAREIAVRVAIGAGRGRIVRQLLTETLVVALIGGGVGVLLAGFAVPVLIAASPAGIPRLEQTNVDGAVLAFALVAAVISALAAGLAPALRAGRTDLRGALNEGGRAGSARRDRLRLVLVGGEMALALMLLVGAGLLVRSAMHLQHVPAGFDPAGVLTARLSLPATEYSEPVRVVNTFNALVATAAASPFVDSAAISSTAPLTPGGNSNGLLPEGKALSMSNIVQSQLGIITPGYFHTLRIPITQGRGFTADDRRGGTKVAIVNETAARLLFPGQDPIGKRFGCCDGAPNQPGWRVIVGVVSDVRSLGATQPPRAEFFLPLDQAPDVAWKWLNRTMTLVVRSRTGDDAGLTAVARDAVARTAPLVPLFQVQTMAQRMHTSLAQARFNTLLMLLLGGIGLVLAAIGIYGVIAYFVAERRRDIGIRLALGARPGNVAAMVARHAAGPVGAGLIVGMVGALALSGVLGSYVYGVTTKDPLTYVAAGLLVVAVACLALVIPARRAIKIDAVRVLTN